MSDISKIKVSGVEYDIKDIQAREDLGNLGTRVSAIEGKEAGWNSKYSKPTGGIPKTDLANDVQTSLGKAETALQEHQSLAAYRTAEAQNIIDNTKQDKLIAGDNITIAADGKTISATGGGSTDAVLYTAQTLTDEQKKQARDNIDAAIADFVVNGTVNSNMEVTLDKTLAQIQAAIQEGKHPVAHIPEIGLSFLPLVAVDTDLAVFAAVTDVSEGTITSVGLTLTDNGSIFLDRSVSPTINSDGALIQYPMEYDPISPMQIATKKYVDDKECILKSTTPGSTKKFKITVDDNGTLSATEVTA